jgi:hypothetical protein
MPIPLWAIKALIAAVLLGGGYAGFEHWKHNLQETADKGGYDRANGEWKLREQGITDAAENLMAQGVAKANAEKAAIEAKFDALSVDKLKEKQNADKKLAAHDAAAAARIERLSIGTATTCSSLPGAAPGAGAGAASGPEGEARVDLLPGTTQTIFRIAADSAGLVRDFNDLQQRYNEARATCNAP